MADLLVTGDLTPFADIDPAKAAAMVVDAVALAGMAAPCLADPNTLTPAQVSQAKAVLRGAVLRWNEGGAGAVSQQTAGPFGVMMDTRQVRRTMFWPSEITALQKICKFGREGGAFSIDTAAEPMLFHQSVYGGVDECGVLAFDVPPADGPGPTLDGGTP